ncbi:hypothetical protein IAQ61_000293 [Plenodomus lingam]|uniref:uncharacterized protein n=1 Tax=Leptosphaeria maculans TaxID=5022 RepID=UPI003320A767|nr:hypothetical protein IAQ61_000293 [Plenodomus lingam]
MDANMYSPTPSSPSLFSTTSSDLPPLLSPYWPELDSPNRNLNPPSNHLRHNTRMNTTANTAQCSSSTPDADPTSLEEIYDETIYECGIFMGEAYEDGAVDNVDVDDGVNVDVEMNLDMDVQLYFDIDGYISQTAHSELYNSTSSPHPYSSSPCPYNQSTQTPASTPIPFDAPTPHRPHTYPAHSTTLTPNPPPSNSTLRSPPSSLAALNPAHTHTAHSRDPNLDSAASESTPSASATDVDELELGLCGYTGMPDENGHGDVRDELDDGYAQWVQLQMQGRVEKWLDGVYEDGSEDNEVCGGCLA